MADAAPPELGELLRNVFYKHYAPLALQNLAILQQYQNWSWLVLPAEFYHCGANMRGILKRV